MSYITVSKTVDVEIDVDAMELVDDLTAREKAELAKALGCQTSAGIGEGDLGADRIIETAFLAAKRMAQVPREIADLFWHVHGRAL